MNRVSGRCYTSDVSSRVYLLGPQQSSWYKTRVAPCHAAFFSATVSWTNQTSLSRTGIRFVVRPRQIQLSPFGKFRVSFWEVSGSGTDRYDGVYLLFSQVPPVNTTMSRETKTTSQFLPLVYQFVFCINYCTTRGEARVFEETKRILGSWNCF